MVAPVQLSYAEFVTNPQRLAAKGQMELALDLIYDRIDEMMQGGEFPKLDSILSSLPVSDLSADILFGFLTATLPAGSRLSSRAGLYGRIEQALRERGEWEEGLLIGLE